jgi:exo-beta-1,3-glucanase (GH17 family)
VVIFGKVVLFALILALIVVVMGLGSSLENPFISHAQGLPQAQLVLSLHQDSSDGASGIVSQLSQVIDPASGNDVTTPLRSFQVELTYDSDCLNIAGVRELDFSISGLKIDNVDGTTSFEGSFASGVSTPANMGHVLTRLVGSNEQACSLSVEMVSLTTVDASELDVVPQITSIDLQRGDARSDGVISIADSLFTAQYLAGSRLPCTDVIDITCQHSVNAASVQGDVIFDKKTIADAVLEAQYLVGLRDQIFDPIPYKLRGINFSPYIDADEDPNLGVGQITTDELKERIELIAPYTEWGRTFACDADLKEAGRLAHDMGLKVAVGVWLNPNEVNNQNQLDCLMDVAGEGNVDLAIIGSEVLLRGDLTEAQLISYIDQAKAELGAADVHIPVTTADVYNEFLSHPTLIEAVDVLFVNYYPYWEGVDFDSAVAFLHAWHRQVKAVVGGKLVYVSETGWPSCGDPIDDAVPSVENAARYFLKFVSWARANDVPFFYFEAFDEDWKTAPEGPQGACWGILDQQGTLKVGMEKVFEGMTLADNWSWIEEIPGGPGVPTIEFTYVPDYRSFDNLKGQVWHISPADHQVAVYIKVGGGWWTKPFFQTPLTAIRPDGSWITDITTGGIDEQATEVVAFLVPNEYNPPLMGGGGTLPAELDQNALARADTTRTVCYSVSTKVVPSNSGTVGTDPVPNCAGGTLYREGTEITLIASPMPGYNFAYWSGAFTSGAKSVTVAVIGNMSITATLTTGRLCPPELDVGETIVCSLDAADEEDTYTFEGEVDNEIMVRMTRTVGEVWPTIRVYDPQAVMQCESRATAGYAATEVICNLSSSGTHSIVVFGGTGGYDLYVQKLNPPAGAVPFSYSESITASIESPSELDIYVMDGQGGDKVLLRISAGLLAAHVRLYDSEGNELCQGGNIDVTETVCDLAGEGTYFIALGARVQTLFNRTGNYELYVQRLNNPSNATDVNFRGDPDRIYWLSR